MPHGTDVYCPEHTRADNKRKCEYTAEVDKFHGGHDYHTSSWILWNVGVVSNMTVPDII